MHGASTVKAGNAEGVKERERSGKAGLWSSQK